MLRQGELDGWAEDVLPQLGGASVHSDTAGLEAVHPAGGLPPPSLCHSSPDSDKHPAPELHAHPPFCFSLGLHHVAPAGPELQILLPQPPEFQACMAIGSVSLSVKAFCQLCGHGTLAQCLYAHLPKHKKKILGSLTGITQKAFEHCSFVYFLVITAHGVCHRVRLGEHFME